MREVTLACGRPVYVDDADFARVAAFSWLSVEPEGSSTYYAGTLVQTPFGQFTLLMHRLLLGVVSSNLVVDHRDGRGFNNTRDNIRACTQAQNMQNRGKTRANTTGFVGVTYDKKRQMFLAQIEVNCQHIYLGRFASAAEAAAAYDASARKYHDAAFLHVNFPGEGERGPEQPAADQVSRRGVLRKRPSKSGYRGVYWAASTKSWQARVRWQGVYYYAGYFDCPTAAATARDELAHKLAGGRAILNLPHKETANAITD
jgi:hypothetical protein